MSYNNNINNKLMLLLNLLCYITLSDPELHILSYNFFITTLIHFITRPVTPCMHIEINISVISEIFTCHFMSSSPALKYIVSLDSYYRFIQFIMSTFTGFLSFLHQFTPFYRKILESSKDEAMRDCPKRNNDIELCHP